MTQPTTSKPRLLYLDITKGILVILMVVYHTLNYTSQYHLAFKYLSFLPSSFILITGFLLSSVYSARYAAGDRQMVGRLIYRGVRLFLLFTALNVVAQFVRSPAYGRSAGVGSLFLNWDEVYLIGGSRIAAFEILLPIAYLLLLAPILIALANRHTPFLPAASALLVAGCTFIEWRFVSLSNLNFLCAGVCGMLAGKLLPNPTSAGRYRWFTLLVYLGYFPVGINKGYIFIVQLFGAIVALALLCTWSLNMSERNWWSQRLARLGQYSLLAYIVQIAILQLLSRVFGRPNPLSIEAALLLLGTLVTMTVAIEGTQWLRNWSRGADRYYRAVFA